METIRVLLIDDHALLRSGLRALLEAEPDLEVVGEAATGAEGIALAVALRPDVVLMDLSLPEVGGLDATSRISAECPGTRVLALTMHAAEEYLMQVLHAGGSGYITKDCPETELLEAIRTVASGHVYLAPAAARLLLENFRSPARAAPGGEPLELLSPREREVLVRTAEGFTAAQIGERLHISPKTVDTYRQRVMEKLHLHHRSELVQFALRQGLLARAG